LLTCKQFLSELNDFLEDTLDPKLHAELKRHVSECPNCWVVCDTTEKTIKVFKGMEAQPVPQCIQDRLMQALEKKMQENRGRTGDTFDA
jgi:hypothetical protein